jgi:selenocysteine lyase/cysteine desulfurase
MADADAEKLRQLRELLPATSAGIYLDTATRGPIPAETAAAMREAEDWELRVGRVWDGREDDVAQRSDEARAVIAAMIGADPDDVALTFGREDSLALAAQAVGGDGKIIDATYRVGVERVDVNGAGAHAIAFAADRWLLGPEGSGALWLADRRAATSNRMLPRTSLIGLARSVGWLEMFVGIEWIYERTEYLAQRLHTTLSATPGVDVLTPPDTIGAIVSFRITNWSSAQAVEELSRRVHSLVGQKPDLHAIVASVAWFNTEDELDRFAQSVMELAAHRPDTLPRRPSLIVLSD